MIAVYGYWVVAVVIVLENVGVPLPGETVLILAGVYAGHTHGLNIGLVIATAATAGVIGSCIGFALGRELGYRLLLRYGSHVGLTDSRIKIGEYLFLKHGGAIILFGRFIAFLRMFAAVLAGANRMSWRSFALFTSVGAFGWATLYGLGAYYAGAFVTNAGGTIALVAAAIAVAIIIATLFYARKHEAELAEKAERALPGPLLGRRLQN